MSQNDLLGILHQGLIEMFMPLDRQIEEQLIRYIMLINKYNKTLKLTNFRNMDAMIKRLLLDSLSIQSYIKGKTILDVGTGGGLPGIPLAIVMPDRQFALLDSDLGKVRFLRKTCHQLHLNNARIVLSPVEKYKTSYLFDAIVSRAFGTLHDCMNKSKHLLKPGGQMLIMKGVYPLTELENVPKFFKLVNVHPQKIPHFEDERHLVELCYQPD